MSQLGEKLIKCIESREEIKKLVREHGPKLVNELNRRLTLRKIQQLVNVSKTYLSEVRHKHRPASPEVVIRLDRLLDLIIEQEQK